MKRSRMKMYVHLVIDKKTGNGYVMIGNMKNPNMGSGRYLYEFVDNNYECPIFTPYGMRCNVSTDLKYNSKDYKIIHQIAM